MAEELSPRALCSLADVIASLDEDTHDPALNDELIRKINAASKAIEKVSRGREFVAKNARWAAAYNPDNPPARIVDPQLRLVDVWPSGSGALPDEVLIGDLATLTALGIGGRTNPTAVTVADVTTLPRTRADDEPIQWLRFDQLYAPAIVHVTGTWGFPRVPGDIREYCILTVKIWMQSDLGRHVASFSLTEDRVVRPGTLPSEVFAGVAEYRRPRVAS